jgi:tetratricopeptide (TPR) repeat protein
MVFTPFVTALFLAVASAGMLFTADAELLRRAETAFRAGAEARDNPDQARPLFRTAAFCYEKLRQRGAANAALYRNLGNCYLLAGDLPRAILSYRRGLRLAPADQNLRSQLAYARLRVAYPDAGDFGRPAVDNRPPWLPYFSAKQRLLFFLCTYSLGWLGIVRWWMVRRPALLTTGLMMFGLAMLAAASLALEEWNMRQEAQHPLVVITADKVAMRKGNGRLYPPRYATPLQRGVEARLGLQRGSWLQIELAGGQLGWIPRSAALVDTP